MRGLIFLLICLLLPAVPARAETVRMALIVGNNLAVPPQRPLRYAERDAVEMKRVLRELGGVGEVELLLGGSADDLRRALSRVGRHAAEARGDVMLFFYYSGHADGSALQMGRTRFPLRELRNTLGGLRTKVNVAILDACQSGQVIRTKGGRPVSVVDVHFDFDQARTYEGRVFITSSANGERAQESDEIGASVFTHYLLSGLRGAADDSGDRRVSLEEAYLYAYQHTLRRTSGTLEGPQHPSVDMNIAGHGQLVLTRLSKGRSYLVFPASAGSTWLVRDAVEGHQVAELTGRQQRIRLAVAPGTYELRQRRSRYYLTQTVRVRPESETKVETSGMVRVALTRSVAKGGQAEPRQASVATTAEPQDEVRGAFERSNWLALAYDLRSGHLRDAGLTHGVQLAYVHDVGPVALGAVAGYARAAYTRQDRIAVTLDEAAVAFRLEARLWTWSRLRLAAGLDVGLAWLWQLGDPPVGANQRLSGPQFTYRIRLGGEVRVADPLVLGLWGHVGQIVLETLRGVEGPFVGGLTVGIAAGF